MKPNQSKTHIRTALNTRIYVFQQVKQLIPALQMLVAT